jgi:two-component system sensor histidine kinase/response regulator
MNRFDAPEARNNGLHILVAEDFPANQMILTALLKARGHRVQVVANGRDAVQALRDGRYDVVLMDVEMPVTDGVSAARLIRALDDEQLARTPILALTADATAEVRRRCERAGMNGMLEKPVQREQLDGALASLVAGVPPQAHSDRPAPLPASGAVSGCEKDCDAGLVDLSQLLRRCMDSREAAREVLESFEKSSRPFQTQFRAAVDAGSLEQARRLAHTLKGAAATLGAQALREASGKLQEAAERRDAAACLRELEAFNEILDRTRRQICRILDSDLRATENDRGIEIDRWVP